MTRDVVMGTCEPTYPDHSVPRVNLLNLGTSDLLMVSDIG